MPAPRVKHFFGVGDGTPGMCLGDLDWRTTIRTETAGTEPDEPRMRAMSANVLFYEGGWTYLEGAVIGGVRW